MNGSEPDTEGWEATGEVRATFAQAKAQRAPARLWGALDRRVRRFQRVRTAQACAAGILVQTLLLLALRFVFPPGPAAEAPVAPRGTAVDLLAAPLARAPHRLLAIERSPELRWIRALETRGEAR